MPEDGFCRVLEGWVGRLIRTRPIAELPSRDYFSGGEKRSDRQDMPPSSFAASELPIVLMV